MNWFYYELKESWLNLQKKPGFVFSVVTTMGVTLGALICFSSLAFELLLKPLPYPDADKLYRVVQSQVKESGEIDNRSFTYPGLIQFYKKQTIFSQAAIIEYNEDIVSSLPSQPRMDLSYVTPEWFLLLGVKMHLGRTFEQTEGVDSNLPVAILSFQTWENKFQANADIIGEKLTLGGVSFRIIGVMSQNHVEPEIHQTGRKTHIWLPWNLSPNRSSRNSWDKLGRFFAVGKLKQELTVSQAESISTPIADKLWQENVVGLGSFEGWHLEMELRSFRDFILGGSKKTIVQLVVAMLALVLLAAANVSNLYLSRTAERYRILSLRAALGARKNRLFRSIMVETGLLLVFSILLASVIATIGFHILQENFSNIFPHMQRLSLNTGSLLVALISTILFSYLFAKLSSQIIRYRSLISILRSSGKGVGLQVSKVTRHILIGTQIAIATTLIFININLYVASATTINEPMGFKIENLHALFLTYSAEKWPSADERDIILNEVEAKLAMMPQVDSVTRTTAPYYGFGQWIIKDVYSNKNYTVNGKGVNDQYFQMIEQSLIEGQYFSKTDIQDENQVAIVNQSFAKTIVPDGSAIGMNFELGKGFRFRIIGVVEDTNIPGRDELSKSVFAPSRKGRNSFTIKTKPDKYLSRAQIVGLLKTVDPKFLVHSFESIEDAHDQWLATQIATIYTTSSLALLSLFLAAIGLYGILSYHSRMRRFEFGTRLALGAKRRAIVLLVFKDNFRPLLLGMTGSVLAILAIYLSNSENLSQYMGIQLVTYFVVTVLLVMGVLLAACYLPVRRFINQPVSHSLRGSE